MKHIFRYSFLVLSSLLALSCSESESDLLEPKVYFETNEYNVTMKEAKQSMDLDISARISGIYSEKVEVSYGFADQSVVEAYNAKHGTNYLPFKVSDAKFSQSSSAIGEGKIFADKVKLQLTNLDKLEEGKAYVLPLKLNSGSVPVISGSDIQYIILSKPVRITKVGTFTSNYISVKFPAGTFFRSFTYEALIYSNRFGSNNTIMGSEGLMIFRVGDTGGGIPSGTLQAAGRQHYEAPDKLEANKWYHLALTFDQPSGKTVMYVNGKKVAESAWSIPGFDPNADVGFNIGKIPSFPWGERPFYGYMSELRVWSVARTEKEIKQNMLMVNPKSEGLELYYKLNGSEETADGMIKDAAKGLNCKTNGIPIKELDAPIEIK